MRAALAAGLTLLVLATAAAGAAPDFAQMQVNPYPDPKPAPAWALPDLGGHTHRLDEMRGKVVMLFFWATW
jgi:hypothetical protein